MKKSCVVRAKGTVMGRKSTARDLGLGEYLTKSISQYYCTNPLVWVNRTKGFWARRGMPGKADLRLLVVSSKQIVEAVTEGFGAVLRRVADTLIVAVVVAVKPGGHHH